MPGRGTDDKGGWMDTEDRDIAVRLDQAEEAIDSGEFKRAEELMESLALDAGAHPRASSLYGLALYFQGEFEEAERHLARAHPSAPDDPDLACALAVSRFYKGETGAAEELLRAIVEVDPEWADAHWWLARVLDWQGEADPERHGEAEREFERAAELEPETFTVPDVLSDGEFRSAVQDAMEDLPKQIAAAAEEVAIMVERYPTESLMSGQSALLAPELLGLYTGVPLPERSTFDSGRPPDVIHLFKRNLELATQDPDELREEIGVTLIHELGHYLGLGESELEELDID
jgi:predicted Zn-dependent protease with MMP-like domain